MTVAVVVPFRGGEAHRDRNWAWLHERWEGLGLEVIEGTTGVDGFSRTQAILDARARTDVDVLVVADADVWCEDLGVAAAQRAGWSVPGMLHRLSPASTDQVLAGEDWRGLPLSTDNRQDAKPYQVHAAGTFLTVTAEAFDLAPPDPRFVGWGQEDDAWAAALQTLVGPPARTGADVVHLWHPPEPRSSRVTGNRANKALARRYHNARRSTALMHTLIAEARTPQEATNG